MKKIFIGIVLMAMFLTGCADGAANDSSTDASSKGFSNKDISLEISYSLFPSAWQKVEFISIGMLGSKEPRIQITNKDHVAKLYELFSNTQYTEPGEAMEGFLYELFVSTSGGEIMIGIHSDTDVSVNNTGYKVSTNLEKELPVLLKEWGYIDTLTP